MSTIKRFFKDTIIYGIAAVLPRAINILLVKLHTSTLQSDKYAENTLYFVYAAYINALLTYGMETAFFRFFTKEKNKGKVISTSFISLLFTTFLFLIFALYYSESLSNFFGFENPIYFQILVLVTSFDTLMVLPFSYLRVMNRPIKFTFYKVLNIFIYAILNIYFLVYIPHAIKNEGFIPNFLVEYYTNYPLVIFIFIANLVASLVTFIFLLPTFFKFKFNFDKQLLIKMLKYGLPLMVGSLAFITNENIDKLLIGNLIGKEQMGIYAACYKIGIFMTLYITAFRLGAEPYFFNQANKVNSKETYAKILTWFTIIGSFFMLFIIVFIDVFANILLGKEEYFQALSIVPIILLANLFLGISYNLSVWYKLTDKTKFGMILSVIAAIITILINIIFIPKIGYMASAWATLLAYSFVVISSYLIGKKYYAVPYPVKKILFYIFISVLFSGLSFLYFRENYFISILMIITFLSYTYFQEKKEIQKIIKK